MISEVTMYGLVCDACNEPIGNEDYDYLVMTTERDIIEEANCQDWRKIDGKWYCPLCLERLFDYDEDTDEFTPKKVLS